MFYTIRIWLALAVFVSWVPVSWAQIGRACSADSRHVLTPTQLPILFIENRGQWPERVTFAVSRGPIRAHFEQRAMVLELRKEQPRGTITRHLVRMLFEGAASSGTLQGEQRRPGYHNFYLGCDPSKWRTRVPGYSSILYRKIYKGIDIRVRKGEQKAQGMLEYDILLAANADLGPVVIRCEGAELEVAEDGALLMHTPLGVLRQPPPVSWYKLDADNRRAVTCRYRLIDTKRFSLEILDRNPHLDLVIDPTIEWLTHLGGTSDDKGNDVKIHADGSVTIVGLTFSNDFPLAEGLLAGACDAFVSHFDDTGRLVWSTVLGGAGDDEGLGVSVEDDGSIIICGYADSVEEAGARQFPAANGAGDLDAFIARVSHAGDLTYATLLGGLGEDGAGSLDLAEDGRVLVTGFTSSPDLPVTADALQPAHGGGIYDWFVACLHGEEIEHLTYLGGTGNEAMPDSAIPRDQLYNRKGLPDIQVLTSRQVVLAGPTSSGDLPTRSAYQESLRGLWDGYVAILDLDLEDPVERLRYGSYLGGVGADAVLAAAVGAHGDLYLVGATSSNDFPRTPGAFGQDAGNRQDGFLTRLRPWSEDQLIYSTYLASNEHDTPGAVAVDSTGLVYIGGETAGNNWPGAVGQNHGSFDGFLMVIDPDRDLLPERQISLSLLIGSNATDVITGLDLAVPDTFAFTGFSRGSVVEATPDAFQPQNAGPVGIADAFVGKVQGVLTFLRADANADNSLDIADAVCVLSYLFGPAGNPCKEQIPTCLDAADSNDDGAVDLADGIYILQNLFANGPAIPPPYPECGVDPTRDNLDCAECPHCKP